MNLITTRTRLQSGLVVPEVSGEPSPSPVEPVAPIDPSPGFTFSNLSGDYGAWSSDWNRLAVLSALDVWYIRDTQASVDTLVGDRTNGGSVMQDFMWHSHSDQYWWLDGAVLERRALDGRVLQEIVLPTQVNGVTVQWRAGSGGGEAKQFIVGYDATAGHFIQWFSEDGLEESFWIGDIVPEKFYHNAHVRESGLAFQPQGDRQSLSFACRHDGSGLLQIEPELTDNDWSHETWDGDLVAVWSNPNGRIEFLGHATLGAATLEGTLTVAAVEEAIGLPGDYIQYQHGDMRSRRLCFSAYNTTTGLFSVLVYDLETEELRVVDREFAAGVPFAASPRPSISSDGTHVVYNSTSGLQVRVLDWTPAAPEQQPLFTWKPGVITASAYSEWLSEMALREGRPYPATNQHKIEVAPGKFFNAPIKHEVPSLDVDGRLNFAITDQSDDLHNDLRLEVPGEFAERWYIPRGVLYRIDVSFEMKDDVGWSLSGGAEWIIPLQMWGPISQTWKDGAHPINPPFALRIERFNHASLKAAVQVYGQSNPNGIDWEYKYSTLTDVSLGKTKASVWLKVDHTGKDSYVRVDLNGKTITELTNVNFGTPFRYDGSAAAVPSAAIGGTLNVGVYTGAKFAAPGVNFLFDEVTLYRLG